MVELAGSSITKIVEKWYLTEPILFAIWTTHRVSLNSHIRTMRVGCGLVEYNPVFIMSLDTGALNDVLFYEAMRILLKHPYTRKKEISSLSYLASNITLQEYCGKKLDFPSAFEVFGTHWYDGKYFEFYYHKLVEKAECKEIQDKDKASGPKDAGDFSPKVENSLNHYRDEAVCGQENVENWDSNDFFIAVVNQKIEDAVLSKSWGSIPGYLQQIIIAGLKQKLDYRTILKSFRASILSTNRVLTRMKPSRRYEFQYMGSRRDFTTRILFAVDVSGSMGDRDIQRGFAVVNRLFKYGIEELTVIQFDTEIKAKKLVLKKAMQKVSVLGRGGTNFQPLMDYIDENRDYDGLIVFTDGYADVPICPKNKKTRIVWLFNTESHYKRMKDQLLPLGKATFLKQD